MGKLTIRGPMKLGVPENPTDSRNVHCFAVGSCLNLLRAESAQNAVKKLEEEHTQGTDSNNSKFQTKQPMNKIVTAINSCNEPTQTFAKKIVGTLPKNIWINKLNIVKHLHKKPEKKKTQQKMSTPFEFPSSHHHLVTPNNLKHHSHAASVHLVTKVLQLILRSCDPSHRIHGKMVYLPTFPILSHTNQPFM